MIMLRIKEKGHYVEIPGLTPVRSPVEINISSVSMITVATYLHNVGIQNYQIISETDRGSKVYTQDDFFPRVIKKIEPKESEQEKHERKINERLDRLEKMLAKIAKNGKEQKQNSEEQITNKLDAITELIKEREKLREIVKIQPETKSVKKSKDEPDIEELDTFIPQIDVSGMNVRGASTKKIEKRDDDADEAADSLSRLVSNNKWRKKQ